MVAIRRPSRGTLVNRLPVPSPPKLFPQQHRLLFVQYQSRIGLYQIPNYEIWTFEGLVTVAVYVVRVGAKIGLLYPWI